MKKWIIGELLICIGLFVLQPVSKAFGEAPNEPLAATALQVAPTQLFHNDPNLVELEKRLRRVILASKPDTKFKYENYNVLVADYSSERFATHLNYTSSSEKFPPNFDEFHIRLSVEEDAMHYRPEWNSQMRATNYGTAFYARHNLRVIADDNTYPLPREAVFSDVPFDHWAYIEYDKLVREGIFPNRFPSSFSSGVRLLTRYEFACWIAQLMDTLEREERIIQESPETKRHSRALQIKFNQAVKTDPELKNSLNALQSEFAVELSSWGVKGVKHQAIIHDQKWQPRYEHLDFSFVYGKGMDKALLEKIQHTIADYAASALGNGHPN